VVDTIEVRQEGGNLGFMHATERQLHTAAIKDKAGNAARCESPGGDDDPFLAFADAHTSFLHDAGHAPGEAWNQAKKLLRRGRHVLGDHA